MPSIVHTVSTCSQCGAPLENVEPFDKECRQILDFLALCFFVLEHCAEHKRCPAPANLIPGLPELPGVIPSPGSMSEKRLSPRGSTRRCTENFATNPRFPGNRQRRRGPTITVILPHERATPQLLTFTERGFPLYPPLAHLFYVREPARGSTVQTTTLPAPVTSRTEQTDERDHPGVTRPRPGPDSKTGPGTPAIKSD